MKHVLVLTSTFPLNRNSPINPCVKNLVSSLSKKTRITLLLPDHQELGTHYLGNVNIETATFKYFWPRSMQKLVYGSGIVPNLRSNPLLLFEILPFFVAQIIAIKKVINSKNVDVILANWAIPSGLSAVLSQPPNDLKLITYIHGSDANIHSRIYNAIFRFVINRSKNIVTVSKPLARKISANSNNQNITVIPQGIKIIKTTKTIRMQQIVFAGRLIEGKGAKNLIDAFRIVLLSHPKLKLLIVGNGPQKNHLERYVKYRDIRNVKFLGNLPNAKLMSILRSSQLLVFPSKLPEGLPNILLEAGICKIPILTTNVGGVGDLISKNSGYFTKINHRHIADNINAILSNYETATAKSNALYNIIKRDFSADCSTAKLLKIIDSS